MIDCGPIHFGDNMSRHSPIFVSFNLGELQHQEQSEQPPPRRLPDWDRATSEEIYNYRSTLQQKLQAISIPECTAQCMDYNCTDESHSSARDTVMLDTLLAVVESSYTSVPLTGSVGGVNGTKRVLPG